MKAIHRMVYRQWILWVLLLLLSTNAEAALKKAPTVKVLPFFTSVKIVCSNTKGMKGYEYYQTSSDGKERKLIKKTTAKSAYVLKLKPGKSYYFKVRGYKGNTYTKFSKTVKVTMPKNKKNATVKTMLKTALKPVGSTLYVWGGGWNKADNGSGKATRTLGVSSEWKKFFDQHGSGYNFNRYRYRITKGLDCSGYIGWVLYNTFETTNNQQGYVMLAQKMAKNFANRGWGTYTAASKVRNHRAGDIMSSSGHVYMVVGECKDGSVVLLHASPPGVFLCGTSTRSGKSNSQAAKLAKTYMKKYYPAYYKKYPDVTRGTGYLTGFSRMRWNVTGKAVMSDPDHYTKMYADEILRDLFQ